MSSMAQLSLLVFCIALTLSYLDGFTHNGARKGGLRPQRLKNSLIRASSNSDWFSQLKNAFQLPQRANLKVSNSIPISENVDVAIIGAGLSGLACARTLQAASSDCNFIVLEADASVGGRVKSIIQDGYILDVGFQVFIDQYPEAKKLFDYEALDLRPFLPGAWVRYQEAFHVVADPFRRPQDIIASLVNPIGSFADKLKVGLFTVKIKTTGLASLLADAEYNTLDYLKAKLGLTDSMVNTFFAPFYQGIFLSPLDLQSSRMFEFVFKMFTEGSATLPAGGMGQVAEQLAGTIPSSSLKLNTRVEQIVKLSDNEYQLVINSKPGQRSIVQAKTIVLACDPISSKQLIDNINCPSDTVRPTIDIPEARGSMCVYFGINGPPPIQQPTLILNGENRLFSSAESVSLVINNVCFPSQVSSNYAPPEKSLASVTIVGHVNEEEVPDEQLGNLVKAQLMEWWGSQVQEWEMLKIFRIPYAQPAQSPLPYPIEGKETQLLPGLFVAGDHRNTATVNGALSSGQIVAREILQGITIE